MLTNLVKVSATPLTANFPPSLIASEKNKETITAPVSGSTIKTTPS
jgi:hypothetical protein